MLCQMLKPSSGGRDPSSSMPKKLELSRIYPEDTSTHLLNNSCCGGSMRGGRGAPPPPYSSTKRPEGAKMFSRPAPPLSQGLDDCPPPPPPPPYLTVWIRHCVAWCKIKTHMNNRRQLKGCLPLIWANQSIWANLMVSKIRDW